MRKRERARENIMQSKKNKKRISSLENISYEILITLLIDIKKKLEKE